MSSKKISSLLNAIIYFHSTVVSSGLQRTWWLAGWLPNPVEPVDAGEGGRVKHSFGRASDQSGSGVGRGALPEGSRIPVVSPPSLGHFLSVTSRTSIRIVTNTGRSNGDQESKKDEDWKWYEDGYTCSLYNSLIIEGTHISF